MRLSELIYIKTVAEEGHVSRAASKLFISQPSLSNAIKKIEADLGALIFSRTKNGLVLTQIGTKYFMMANSILKIYSDFENEVHDIDQLAKGKVHFGITNYVGSLLLPTILPNFSHIAPNIEVTFEENRSLELLEMLKLGKIDFAVLHIDHAYNDDFAVKYHAISTSRFLLATQKNHPNCCPTLISSNSNFPKVDLNAFTTERFILSDYDQMSRSIAKRIFKSANFQPQKTLVTRNLITSSKLASTGFGVTFFPEMYLPLIAHQKSLDFYTIGNDYDCSWELVVATLNHTYQPKSTTLFIDLIKDYFSPENPVFSTNSNTLNEVVPPKLAPL